MTAVLTCGRHKLLAYEFGWAISFDPSVGIGLGEPLFGLL